MTFEDLCRVALTWPGVERSTSYGTPALKVRGKFLARLREDGDSLVVPGVPPEERDMLIAADPAVFYVTDHYRDWPMVLVRLSRAAPGTVEGLVQRHWRAVAPKTLVRAFDAAK